MTHLTELLFYREPGLNVIKKDQTFSLKPVLESSLQNFFHIQASVRLVCGFTGVYCPLEEHRGSAAIRGDAASFSTLDRVCTQQI